MQYFRDHGGDGVAIERPPGLGPDPVGAEVTVPISLVESLLARISTLEAQRAQGAAPVVSPGLPPGAPPAPVYQPPPAPPAYQAPAVAPVPPIPSAAPAAEATVPAGLVNELMARIASLEAERAAAAAPPAPTPDTSFPSSLTHIPPAYSGLPSSPEPAPPAAPADPGDLSAPAARHEVIILANLVEQLMERFDQLETDLSTGRRPAGGATAAPPDATPSTGPAGPVTEVSPFAPARSVEGGAPGEGAVFAGSVSAPTPPAAPAPAPAAAGPVTVAPASTGVQPPGAAAPAPLSWVTPVTTPVVAAPPADESEEFWSSGHRYERAGERASWGPAWLLTTARWVVLTLIGIIVLGLLAVSIGPKLLPYQALVVRSGSMAPTIPTGSVVFYRHIQASDVKVGDIIVFSEPDDPGVKVTHRVYQVVNAPSGRYFITKGDANGVPDSWRVPGVGTGWLAVWHVPEVGYLLADLQSTAARFLLLVIPALALGGIYLYEMWWGPREEEEADRVPA